jgi:predicted  nucleic acid-binding Zn-ribbon protein
MKSLCPCPSCMNRAKLESEIDRLEDKVATLEARVTHLLENANRDLEHRRTLQKELQTWEKTWELLTKAIRLSSPDPLP